METRIIDGFAVKIETRVCPECKGIGMEIFIDSNGEEKLGAGFCPTCIGRGFQEKVEEDGEVRWE